MIESLYNWFIYALMSLPSVSVTFNVLVIFLFAWYIKKTIDKDNNTMQWSDAISTKGSDGIEHFDWDKVGKGCGVLLALAIPFYYVHSDKPEASGLALIMGTSLLYLGAVSGYSAYIRSKQNKEDSK